MRRLGHLLLLLALLPGLGLGEVGHLRLCLAGLVGGSDCCDEQRAELPSGCCSALGALDERERADRPGGGPCTLCCVELDDEGAVARVTPRVDLDDLAFAAPLAPCALRAPAAPWRVRALPPAPIPRPPGLATNLPLRL